MKYAIEHIYIENINAGCESDDVEVKIRSVMQDEYRESYSESGEWGWRYVDYCANTSELADHLIVDQLNRQYDGIFSLSILESGAIDIFVKCIGKYYPSGNYMAWVTPTGKLDYHLESKHVATLFSIEDVIKFCTEKESTYREDFERAKSEARKECMKKIEAKEKAAAATATKSL